MRFLASSVAVVFALTAGPAAHGQETEPDLEMGARLVEARCSFCHAEKSLPDLVARCAGTHGQEYLDEFLSEHHAPDDEARADIIAYLTCDHGE